MLQNTLIHRPSIARLMARSDFQVSPPAAPAGRPLRGGETARTAPVVVRAAGMSVESSRRLGVATKWVLSAKDRDLKTRVGKQSLSEKFGGDVLLVARQWLRVRPEGGRVFVYADGHATTPVGGVERSLGLVPREWLAA